MGASRPSWQDFGRPSDGSVENTDIVSNIHHFPPKRQVSVDTADIYAKVDIYKYP